jgi:protein phosphatase
MSTIIKVPRRTLLVLCGPAGSGKSTFAAQRFRASTIVSSDHCRELICDDVTNQHVNRDTFDLFYYIINKRMYNGRFTVADSTALQSEARHRLRELARRHGYLACLLIFNVPATVCLQRNQKRTRKVEEYVIPYHARLLQQTLLDGPNEGWDQIHVLEEGDVSDAKVEIEMK